MISRPAADVVRGAIAGRTTRIRLGSAVTVLSSEDPIRVFQRYSTLDAIPGGRRRSSSDEVRASTRSRSSVTTWPTRSSCSERRPTSSQSCPRVDRLPAHGRTRAPLRSQNVVPHIEFGAVPRLDRRRRRSRVGRPCRPVRVLAPARDHREKSGAVRASVGCSARRYRSSGSPLDRSGCTHRVTPRRPEQQARAASRTGSIVRSTASASCMREPITGRSEACERERSPTRRAGARGASRGSRLRPSRRR
jgi:Luciferase-like monooxygenase